MNFELISDQDFANLPEEPTQKFVALEQICRRNLNELVNEDSSSGLDRLARMQYMSIVAAAAEELGVGGLTYPEPTDDSIADIESFTVRAVGVSTRLKLRSFGANYQYSVRLAAGSRGRIEQQIVKLRHLIGAEEMPDGRRKSLLAKLDELSTELSQPRVSFAKVMAVLAYVGATVTGGTTFLAEAPKAMATITRLLGEDKAAEDAEAARLGPPNTPKVLPAMPPKPKALPPEGSIAALDDDIPF